MSIRQMDPDELTQLVSGNLLVAAGVKYQSQVIPVDQSFAYLWNVDVFGDAAVGDFKLTVEVMRKNQSDVLFAKDIATGISSIGGGIGLKVSHQLTWGGGVDALVDSASGVIGSNVGILKVNGFIRLVLEVTTLATGTAGQCFAVSELITEDAPGRTP